jgi:hypothetical protein
MMNPESNKGDFYPGMKVFLNGEYGVVTDRVTEWDGVYFVDGIKRQGSPTKQYGFIHWDTILESDLENWTGLFGSFIAAGGTVISEEYRFRFITDDGATR